MAVTAVPWARRDTSVQSARTVPLHQLLAVGAAALLVSSVLAFLLFDRPVPALAPSLVGSPSVVTELAVSRPAVKGAPVAEPTFPIDVPANPYAPERVVRIGRLAIPKLGVDQKLMHGVTLNNIDHGPSHWPGSAYPGQAGNVVVAGHRVTNTKPFRNIDQLKQGDEIVVEARGLRATYSMTSAFVVSPSGTHIASPTSEPTLTIFACHPPGSARQRIVVRFALQAVENVPVLASL